MVPDRLPPKLLNGHNSDRVITYPSTGTETCWVTHLDSVMEVEGIVVEVVVG